MWPGTVGTSQPESVLGRSIFVIFHPQPNLSCSLESWKRSGNRAKEKPSWDKGSCGRARRAWGGNFETRFANRVASLC